MTFFFLIYLLIGLIALMAQWDDLYGESNEVVLVIVFGWAVFVLLWLISATLRRIPEWPASKGGVR